MLALSAIIVPFRIVGRPASAASPAENAICYHGRDSWASIWESHSAGALVGCNAIEDGVCYRLGGFDSGGIDEEVKRKRRRLG